MIYTGNYYNCKSNLFKTYSISGDRGKMASYEGECYPALAPKKGFWEIWHNNIGKISDEENMKYYIREYWLQVLSKLDIDEVYKELDRSILLCYESPEEFCHREIVAAWFEIFLIGVSVPEVKIDDIHLEKLERPNHKKIKKYLEEVIRETTNMRGFSSLKALHLFEQSEKLEKKANELEQIRNKHSGDYRQAACYKRCDADMVEAEYKQYIKNK